MNTRFFGTDERPYNSYNCGVMHDVYTDVALNHRQIKEEVQFQDIRNELINKYKDRINIG